MISATTTYAVRHPVLRAGQPLASCAMDGDDLPGSYHVGGFKESQLIAVASFMAQSNAHFKGIQNRLRGMAVLREFQQLGAGRQILLYGEELLRNKGVGLLWLNARVGALPFYKKMGYTALGTPFDIEPIGTHYLMFKKL